MSYKLTQLIKKKYSSPIKEEVIIPIKQIEEKIEVVKPKKRGRPKKDSI